MKRNFEAKASGEEKKNIVRNVGGERRGVAQDKMISLLPRSKKKSHLMLREDKLHR